MEQLKIMLHSPAIGFKGSIKLFVNSQKAIDFIMAFNNRNQGMKTIDLLFT